MIQPFKIPAFNTYLTNLIQGGMRKTPICLWVHITGKMDEGNVVVVIFFWRRKFRAGFLLVLKEIIFSITREPPRHKSWKTEISEKKKIQRVIRAVQHAFFPADVG